MNAQNLPGRSEIKLALWYMEYDILVKSGDVLLSASDVQELQH